MTWDGNCLYIQRTGWELQVDREDWLRGNVAIMSSLGPNLYAIRAKGAFEKSKLKGTYPNDTNAPKEKHVQSTSHSAILWTLQGQNMETPPETAYNSLCQRLMTSEWVVALKTEIILHRAVEQVGPGFAARLAELNIPMQNFNDPSEKGSAHNRIIQDYFSYIRTKAHNHSRRGSVMLSAPPERAKAFERMSSADLLREVGFLLTQMQNLVKIAPSADQALRNYHLKLTQDAVYHLLSDGTPLYMTCAIGVDRIIDKFGEMDKGLGEIAIEHYKRFESAGRLLGKFFALSQHLPRQVSPPSFIQRPREVILSMQSAIEEKSEYFAPGSSGVPQSDPLGSELHMSKEELELQRQMMEQYERENEKRVKETHAQRELLSEPIPEPRKPEPEQKPPSQMDLIMGSFNAPPPAAPGAMPGSMPGAMPGSMPGMPAGGMPGMPAGGMPAGAMPGSMPGMPAGGMPGAMPGMMPGMMPNPMMAANPAMFNPMMMNPMNPFMSMMMNPMMTGMPMNPGMMTAPPPAPQVKCSIDPQSKASGQIVTDVRGGRPPPPGDPFTIAPSDPFSSNAKAYNPFETGSSSRASNPFDDFGPPKPGPSSYGGNQGKGKSDPFGNLL